MLMHKLKESLLILPLCRSELRCEEFWQEWKGEYAG